MLTHFMPLATLLVTVVSMAYDAFATGGLKAILDSGRASALDEIVFQMADC